MAGTIFGLPLSQRVDSNGKPLSGWLVFLYVQNSSTPVNSYQDTGLTVLNTWPVEADAAGMLPQFWLADGSYRVRATTNDGSITLFDMPSVQAIGPSSGTAPSGSVDPNAIFQTGDVMWLDVTNVIRAGWVRDNGRTIGSASSGALERANADCHPLFLFLWANYADDLCPVVGGRGGTAEGDWGLNKKITLLDKRGVGIVGHDAMGNTNTNYFQNSKAPFWIGSDTTKAGTSLGEITHSLGLTEIPSHNHSATVGSATVAGTVSSNVTLSAGVTSVPTTTGTISVSIGSVGSGLSHNIVQPVAIGTYYRKL